MPKYKVQKRRDAPGRSASELEVLLNSAYQQIAILKRQIEAMEVRDRGTTRKP